MDIILIIIGFLFICLGIIGSFLPILPGPPTGWVGLLLLHLTNTIPTNSTFLWITFIIAIFVTILDYIIPPLGTKKFGGSKLGVRGSTIGLIVGLFLGPIGIIFGPFFGAFIGEIIENKNDYSKALKAAFGSLIGFLLSTGLKFGVGVIFLIYFLSDVWEYKATFFTF